MRAFYFIFRLELKHILLDIVIIVTFCTYNYLNTSVKLKQKDNNVLKNAKSILLKQMQNLAHPKN